MAFKADDAVSKLEWDFTRYVPKAKGVAPEPTAEAIAKFQSEYNAHVEAVRRVALGRGWAESRAEEDPKKRAEKMRHWAELSVEENTLEVGETLERIMSAEDRLAHQRKVAELIAGVTEDNPSVEQIMGLPGRIRTAFYGWFVGQLLSPEALTVATN